MKYFWAITVLILIHFPPVFSAENARNQQPSSQCTYPVLNDFFGYGIYDIGPYPKQEFWNRKHLNRNTLHAFDRHYRHLILNNFNLFHYHHNSSVPILYYLRAAQKYGGKLIFPLPAVIPDSTGLGKSIRRQLKFVRPFADNLYIHSWRLPPLKGMNDATKLDYISQLKEKIYKLDPLHPLTALVKKPSSPLATQFTHGLGACRFLYGNHIPGNDLRLLENIVKKYWHYYKKVSRRECILWAGGDTVYYPNPVDIRAQVFHALASGWNSLTFFYAPLKAPSWANWSEKSPKNEQLNVLDLQSYGFSNSFEYEPDFLKEASRLGELIIPLGGFFIRGQYNPAPAHTVNCVKTPILRNYTDPATGHVKLIRTPEPAIGIGVWKLPDAELLVVYNRDMNHPHTGTVRLHRKTQKTYVYNLINLNKISVKNNSFKIDLRQGDGNFFLLADENAFKKHCKEIYRRKFLHESNKLRIKIDIADGTKLLTLTHVEKQMENAQNAFSAGKYHSACELLDKVNTLFNSACAQNNNFKTITSCLRQSSNLLWNIDLWLKQHLFLLITPPDGSKAMEKLSLPLGTGRPNLETILEHTRILSSRYYPLAMSFEAGKQTEPKMFKMLLDNLKNTYRKLETYTLKKGPDPRVGFLVFDDEFDRNAWDFLRSNVSNCELLRLSSDGLWYNHANHKISLSDFDVIWFHYVHPRGKAFLDKAESIRAPKILVNPGVLYLIKDYLVLGKGMLLTGLAPAIVNKLGVESIEPNIITTNTYRFINGIHKSNTDYQAIGLKQAEKQLNHPVFRNLPSSSVFLFGDNASQQINHCTWTYPRIPQNGNILAWQTAALNLPPDKLHYDLVEFQYKGKGRIITLSLPKLNFSTKFKTTEHNVKNFHNLVTFMHNIFAYLGNRDNNTFKLSTLDGPFYHHNFADSTINHGLKVKTSSGTGSKTPFGSDKAICQWQSKSTPAWIEIDFGCDVEIQKIHLYSYLSSTSPVQEFSFKFWDPVLKQFTETNPVVSYKTDNPADAFSGITFTFGIKKTGDNFSLFVKPVRTRKIRIENLNGSSAASDKADTLGVNIADIIVYGRKIKEKP